jgi:hypothetical protein
MENMELFLGQSRVNGMFKLVNLRTDIGEEPKMAWRLSTIPSQRQVGQVGQSSGT